MKSRYIAFCLLITNLLLIFLIVNFTIFVAYSVHDKISSRLRKSQAPSRWQILTQGHPGWTRAQIGELHGEMRRMVHISAYDYDFLTQLRPRPFHGKYVNVDRGGFRRIKHQGSWPPDPHNRNIFVFGGSTTFGLEVADWETIPSYLEDWENATQKTRPVWVYNFGRLGYFSTDELRLFLSLLREGSTPSVAVFIDGVNECGLLPGKLPPAPWPDGFVAAAIGVQQESARGTGGTFYFLKALQSWPFGELAADLRTWLGGVGHDQNSSGPNAFAAMVPRMIFERWMRNRQVISRLAQSYGVETVFVWQPIPTYKYDSSHDLLGPRQAGVGPAVYALVDQIEAGGSLGRDFLNLSGVQRNQTQNLYVDPWHYTAAFSAEIAKRIAQFLERPR